MNMVLLMWSLAATVLSGSFILVTLIVPQIGAFLHLSTALGIIAAAFLGAIAAIPVAFLVVNAMQGTVKKTA